MPTTSPKAIERKNLVRREKRAAAKAAAHKPVEIKKSDLPGHKITARRMMGKMPPMSKAEMREMLAQAMQNTARKA